MPAKLQTDKFKMMGEHRRFKEYSKTSGDCGFWKKVRFQLMSVEAFREVYAYSEITRQA